MSGTVLTLPGGGNGEPGPPGPQGPPGPVAPSVFFYRVDAQSISVSDPGSGKIRFDDPEQQKATRLVVDWLTDDGFDAHVYYRMTPAASQLLIQDADLADTYQVWEVIGHVESTDWFFVNIRFVDQSGPGGICTFPNNTKVAVIVQSVPPAVRGIGDRLNDFEVRLQRLETT